MAITIHSGEDLYFKCPYHAKVMKMLDIVSSRMVRIGVLRLFMPLRYPPAAFPASAFFRLQKHDLLPASGERPLLPKKERFASPVTQGHGDRTKPLTFHR
jgi:hypothetical protein